jgi:8-oxo-dGTP pyrophosphatase MutT (NUDIX family)
MRRAAAGLDPAWLERLAGRLDRAPLRPRAALRLGGAGRPRPATIGSIEPALAARLAGAGLPLVGAGDAWQIEPAGWPDADAAFAAIAVGLRKQGAASAWRDELLSVVDEGGAPVGAIERAAVRPLGIATHAVHLVVRDRRGRVWVQQRALDKATDPGRWDTTVGGLAAAGESAAQTLERETWEEAGLRVGELHDVASFGRFTVRRPLAEGYMVEHIEMLEAVLPDEVGPANQDGEVARFECVDRAALLARLHADAFTLEAAMILARWLAHGQRAAV